MKVATALLLVLCCFVSLSFQRDWVVVIEEIQPFAEANIVSGDTVTWINNDVNVHQLNGSAPIGISPILNFGDEYVVVFNGTTQYRYHDTFYPDVMTGEVNVFSPAIFYLLPPVHFSVQSYYYSPLPGFSFTVMEAVSTAFSSTSGIFAFPDGYSATVRQVSTNYFLSPDEIPDAGSTLQISVLSLLFCLIIAYF